jgi:hypothetical protein
MRALFLVVAVLLSAGSAHSAKQRYAVRSYACNSSTTMSPMQRQNCLNSANTEYAVESQQEMIEQQNAYVADQQLTGRCERVAGIFIRCALVTPAEAATTRDSCVGALQGRTPPVNYGIVICAEQAATCDEVSACFQQPPTPRSTPTPQRPPGNTSSPPVPRPAERPSDAYGQARTPSASGRHLLFGGEKHDVYLGCLCSEYDAESVFNSYGRFGNEYCTDCIWNSYGKYGSAYSSTSVCNEYASDPPVVVDGDGKFYGRLTLNEFNPQRVADDALLEWLDKKVCHR